MNSPSTHDELASLTKFIEKNYSRLLKKCQKKFPHDAEDVLHTAILIALERKYFSFAMLNEASRSLKIATRGETAETYTPLPPLHSELDERLSLIRALYPDMSPVIDLALQGYTIKEIARMLKISPSRLSRQLARIGGRSTGQMHLFIPAKGGAR